MMHFTAIPVPLRLGIFVVAAFIIQLGVLNTIHIWGVPINLMITLPIAAGLVAGGDIGASVGFFGGVLLDLYTTTPFGLTALSWTLVGYGVGFAYFGLLRDSPVALAGIATAGFVGAIAVFVLTGAIVGQEHLLRAPLVPILVTGLITTPIFVLALMPLIRFLALDSVAEISRRR